jgi:hypothetical protein
VSIVHLVRKLRWDFVLGSIDFDAPPPRARVVAAQHGRPHAGPDAVRGHHHASIHIRHAAVKVQCDVPLMLSVAQHLVPAMHRSARDQLCKCALGLQQNTRWRGGGWGGSRFIAVAWGGGYLVGLGRVMGHGTGRSRTATVEQRAQGRGAGEVQSVCGQQKRRPRLLGLRILD